MVFSLLFLVCIVPGLVCAASITITQPNGGFGIIGTDCGVSFNIKNTNSYAIVLTDIEVAARTAVASSTVTLYMKTTPVTSSPVPINSGNGWNAVASATVAFPTADVIQPAISGMSVTIPANTEYGFFVSTSSGAGLSYVNTPAILVLSGGGVDLTVGGTAGYGIILPSTTFNPRQFRGSITFSFGGPTE